MKKYIIRTLMLCCILLAIIPALCTAHATEGYLVASGTYGDNLTWTLDNFGTLTVSGTGDMVDYETYPWNRKPNPFMDMAAQSVVIEPGVTSISRGAFFNMQSLTSVTLPEGITRIENSAFMNCYNLASINIPNSVATIERAAFSHCGSLTNISLPENLTSISEQLFERCYNLAEINIPESVTSIGKEAFSSCDKLTKLDLPAGLTYIGDGAFSGCTGLISITIPEGITSIGYDLFFNCYNLTSISIPRSITAIWNNAFVKCDSLTDVFYGGSKAQWDTIDISWDNDVLFSANLHTNETPFVDISPKDYYYDPIVWALAEHITTGMDAAHFAPANTCTRGQVVTFLWRANGSPEPESDKNPFNDVSSSDYFYKAVLWAVGKGITTGTSATTFAPDASCTRGQVATFLWRAADQPASGENNIFTDIASDAYYYDAVLWAVANSITNGMGDGLFAPDATCTRGQIVAFLYRAMA